MRRKVISAERTTGHSRYHNMFNCNLECGHKAVAYGIGEFHKKPPKTTICYECKSIKESS